jgi:hypothetical protein
MGIDEAGIFVADAKERGLTPEQYANMLVAEHGNVIRASMATGYFPNVFHYWRGAKVKQVTRQRERRHAMKAAQKQSK